MNFPPTTRPSLLIRLRDSQDHEAWLEFVELYEPAIYRQLRKCGLQEADVRELMQEIFLAVTRQIPNWKLDPNRGSFRGWLRRVTRNLVINWINHGQRRMLAFGGFESQEVFDNLAADSAADSSEFDLELRRSIFHRAAEILRQEHAPQAWQAFWGTAVEGKATSLVARELRMTDGAVRVAKCRILARLKEIVNSIEAES